MAFIRKEGKTKIIYRPMTASTVATAGDIMSYASGLLIPATNVTTALSHAGVLVRTIATTDADYATSGRLVAIEVPVEKNVYWSAPTTGLVAADVGLEVDLTNAGTIDRSASAVDVAKVEKRVSATLGWFMLKLGGSY